MRYREPPRVLGPYHEENNRWRLIVIDGGKRRSVLCETQGAALRAKARLTRELRLSATQITTALIAGYFEDKVGTGVCLPQTRTHQEPRLRQLLGAYRERPIGALTPRVALLLYEKLVRTPCRKTGLPPAAASHRMTLKIARGFGRWVVERGLLRENPFSAVKPVGKEKSGKPQLRLEEARRLTATALRHYEAYADRMALAVTVTLMMGLRATEALARQVRDLDDGGRVLWIDVGKTRNARRRLHVPQALRPHLTRLANERAPDGFLFATAASGRAPNRQALHRAVWRLCDAAGVPRVCPHSLRGLYATLAVESGAVSDAVAASLGHSSFSITERHYASAAAVHNARTARVESLLDGSPEPPPAAPERVSVSLDRDMLIELLALAKNRPPAL